MDFLLFCKVRLFLKTNSDGEGKDKNQKRDCRSARVLLIVINQCIKIFRLIYKNSFESLL